ncbi:MAG: hypothetical protein RMJ66_05415 [Bacteroidia bacterium]|nr:hypothetical protein [Bacteroidia bacterium]MDW8134487.1 hypothetical protein [Bacteroidia bacterium]
MLSLYSLKFAYQLISRMDSSEMRYFKRFSGFHAGEKFYMNLFERLHQLHRQRVAPKQVRSLIRESDAHLPQLVRHLNERLLEALTFYYETNSSEHTLAKSLRRAELLQYKGFISLLPKLLIKVYQQALHEERFALALQAVDMLRQMWGMNLIRGKGYKAEDLFRYTERVLSYLNYIHKAWYAAALYAEIILEEGEPQPRERLLVIDQFVSRLALQPPEPSDPLTLHFYYDTGQAIRARLYGDYEKYLELTRLLVYKMEQKPRKLRFLQARYLIALSNLLSGLTEKRAYAEAWGVLEKVRQINPASRYLALQKERLLLFHELNLSFMEGRSDAIAARYPEFLQRLENTYLRSSPAYAVNSYYLLAFNLYAAQKVEPALQVLAKVEQGAMEMKRRDLLIAGLILRLLVSVQSGNSKLLRAALWYAYRRIKRLRSTSAVEKIFIEFVQNALRGEYPTVEKALDAFHQALQKARETGDLALKRFWEVFFPTEWLEKKLEDYRAYVGKAKSPEGNRFSK